MFMVDEFSKYTKAVLIREKEADTVITNVYKQRIIGTHGNGATRHTYTPTMAQSLHLTSAKNSAYD